LTMADTHNSDRIDRDLTILLTLKDRPDYTSRWMDYADRIEFPFKVLIADGSLGNEARNMLADRKRSPNVHYEYIRYSPDNSYSVYYAKMADALGRVKTPYVAMADNDDFFVVNTLRNALSYLSANADYISCGGQGAIFWVESPARRAFDSPLYGGKIDWKCTREMRSIDAETAAGRLKAVSLSKSDTFYYDVKRTEVARKHFELVRDLNLRDLFLVEHLVWHLSAVAGKTKRLDELYLARQQNAPESSGGFHAQQFGDWLGRMLVASWSEDFTKFLDVVAPALAAKDNISREEARRCVVESYRASVAPSLLSDIMSEPTVTLPMSGVVGAVRRLVRLPESSTLRRVARMVYRRLGLVSLDIVYGTEYLAVPVPKAKRDFKPIREFLAHRK
jgi:glycosyltransferase domain-containing protein